MITSVTDVCAGWVQQHSLPDFSRPKARTSGTTAEARTTYSCTFLVVTHAAHGSSKLRAIPSRQLTAYGPQLLPAHRSYCMPAPCTRRGPSLPGGMAAAANDLHKAHGAAALDAKACTASGRVCAQGGRGAGGLHVQSASALQAVAPLLQSAHASAGLPCARPRRMRVVQVPPAVSSPGHACCCSKVQYEAAPTVAVPHDAARSDQCRGRLAAKNCCASSPENPQEAVKQDSTAEPV